MSGSRGRRGPGGRRPARDGAWVFRGTQMWSRAGRLRRGLALPRAPAGRCLGCRGAPAERRTGRLPTRFRTFVLLSRKGLPLGSSVQRCSELARFRTLLISLSGWEGPAVRGGPPGCLSSPGWLEGASPLDTRPSSPHRWARSQGVGVVLNQFLSVSAARDSFPCILGESPHVQWTHVRSQEALGGT